VSQQFFFTKDAQLFSRIYDFSSGNLYEINISKTLKNSALSIREAEFSLPEQLFDHVFIDTTRLLCREINPEHTQLTRFVLDGAQRETSANQEKLNLASVSPGQDHNILAVHTKSRPGGERIVEAAIGLNQINLYSLDDSFGKTICVGEKIDDIPGVENTPRFERLYMYMNLNVYPDFFAALYLGDTEMKYELGESINPVIQFFDWDGKPLAVLVMDRMITSFTIDFANGHLYTLNLNNEACYRYEISDLLAEL
jgi:hypothetical protein